MYNVVPTKDTPRKSVLVALAVDGLYHVKNHVLDTHSKEGEILAHVASSDDAIKKLTPVLEDIMGEIKNITSELALANQRITLLDNQFHI